MKTLLRITSGILALLSLLLAGFRLYAISAGGLLESATIMHVMGLMFPLSVTLLCGYMAIKGRMPFMDEQKAPPSENPRNGSH